MPVVRKQFKTIHKRSDNKGSFFIVEEEPEYGNWKVYVHLCGEKNRRLIGEIDTENLTMFVRRKKERHFHHKMMAYGFNYVAIQDIGNLRNILMLEEIGDRKTYYIIPVKFIKEHGVVKNFSKSGFELQIFLRYEHFERFRSNQRFVKGRLVN